MNRLQGKTAIITGANSGIGKAAAIRFAEEGADLVLAARRLDRLEEVEASCKALGVRAVSVATDVSKEADCVRLVEEAVKAFGKVDILVNNAGIADKHRPITRLDTDWYREVCLIDQDSVYFMMREVLKYMEPAGAGSIVNISSIGGVRCNSGLAYSAAKAAVIGMTKNVAIQFAGTGIRVNAVCPGPTPTELNTPEQLATFDSEFAAQCVKHMNVECPEVPAVEQANAILFFASDDAKCVTGQVLTVDNGTTI